MTFEEFWLAVAEDDELREALWWMINQDSEEAKKKSIESQVEKLFER